MVNTVYAGARILSFDDVHLAMPHVFSFPPHQLASIAQHGLPITHLSFMPGRATSAALSVDRRGRMVHHSFSGSSIMAMLRPSVTSRVVVDGTLGQVRMGPQPVCACMCLYVPVYMRAHTHMLAGTAFCRCPASLRQMNGHLAVIDMPGC